MFSVFSKCNVLFDLPRLVLPLGGKLPDYYSWTARTLYYGVHSSDDRNTATCFSKKDLLISGLIFHSQKFRFSTTKVAFMVCPSKVSSKKMPKKIF